MVFRRVDPEPFIPHGMDWQDVPHRVQAQRVLSFREQPRNEDLAIVNFHSLPAHQVPFGNVRELVREFLVDFMGVRIREILPYPLGQAFVRFERVYDRDSFVQHSPLPFGDVNLTFSRHDDGWNHRAVLFNRECWLLILNLPADYWKQEHIERIVGPFGHLGDSWTLQCEILQHRLLENMPADEDFPPSPDRFGPNRPFDFFGFGQPGPAPFLPPPQQNPGQGLNLAHGGNNVFGHNQAPEENLLQEQDEGQMQVELPQNEGAAIVEAVPDLVPEDDPVLMDEVIDPMQIIPPGLGPEDVPGQVIDEPDAFAFDDGAPLEIQGPQPPNPDLEVFIPHVQNPKNFLVDEFDQQCPEAERLWRKFFAPPSTRKRVCPPATFTSCLPGLDRPPDLHTTATPPLVSPTSHPDKKRTNKRMLVESEVDENLLMESSLLKKGRALAPVGKGQARKKKAQVINEDVSSDEDL
ncbi:hypothetical protein U9M48_026449 [Paspalum notatum var. saurae]|uniref:DUF7597 domain-containing protein n=1 Tax=Paspalum notatum var. saurae TaxID=547442 RepID=A0AAQ3TSJ0_PASNO